MTKAMRCAVIVMGACVSVLTVRAQNMVAGEYWVDSDPGWGAGLPIAGIPPQPEVAGLLFAIPTGGLAPGNHIVGLRTRDANGHWSLTRTIPVYVNPALDDADIVRSVYFWNTDTGWNNGTDAGVDGASDVNGTVTASLNGTVPGMNNLFVRSLGANGHWSLTRALPVYVDAPDEDAAITRTEYFWNTDPGWALGANAGMDGQPDLNGPVVLSTADATDGLNTLFIRSLDAHGHWSLTRPIPIHTEAGPSGVMVAAESFWDVDPGFGSGDPVPGWSPGTDVQGAYDILVPFGLGLGAHRLFIRTIDSHGHWSLTNWEVDSVIVDGTTDAEDLWTSAGISTYPNPFTEGITVRTAGGAPVRVVIYDPQGKLVHDKMLSGETRIDLREQGSGAYTAFFWKADERIHTTTLIKH